jgi:hypothetical protein
MQRNMKTSSSIFTVAAALFGGIVVCNTGVQAFAVKDQSRLQGMEDAAKPDGSLGSEPLAPLGPLSPKEEEGMGAPPSTGSSEPPASSGQPSETHEQRLGEEAEGLAAQEQVPLTEDAAKRAIEAFIKLKSAYQDTDIAEYETLEQFVAEAKEGPALEADIKSFGFESVGEWNNTIMSVSFAYAAVATTQEEEILQELENIRNDTSLEEEVRKSLLESLEAMLPSNENKDVVRKLNEDNEWAEKLKMLTEEEAGGSEH